MRKTQAAIKHALTERFYAWEDARKLAQTDEEVNLSGNGPAYTPGFSNSEFEDTARGQESTEQSPSGERSEGSEESKPSEGAVDPSTIPNPAKAHGDAPRV